MHDMTLVCPDCFGDRGLQRRIIDIRADFPDNNCDFHPTKKGIPVSEVAEIVDQVFRNSYVSGQYNSHSDEYEGDDLIWTLSDLTKSDDENVTSALAEALISGDDFWPWDGDEAFYSYDVGYVANDHGYDEHSNSWRIFRREILHEQRFFSQQASRRLGEIFDGLHLLRDNRNSAAVYTLEADGLSGQVYRARKANSTAERQKIMQAPATELGPPPEKLRRAGRMNPSGILAFYGAFDLETCVAELRPAVGETVISAKFLITRPLLVLDTTKFTGRPKATNIFAPSYVKKMRLWKFMTTFMNEIAQPCLPDDEHLDYVPTQVVSEYLTNLHKFKLGEKEMTIDAIIYRSAQNGNGKNIAIFGMAAEVEGAEICSHMFYRSNQPALSVIIESVTSHKVTSVSHEKLEVYTPPPTSKANQVDEDEEFDFSTF